MNILNLFHKKKTEKINYETEKTKKINNVIALKYSDYPKTNLTEDKEDINL